MLRTRVWMVVFLALFSVGSRADPDRNLKRAIINNDQEGIIEALKHVDLGLDNSKIYNLIRQAVRSRNTLALTTLLRVLDCLNDDDEDRRSTPLHIATWHGLTGAIDLLINAGMSLNVRDRFGWTPLHIASYLGNTRITMQFLRNDADPTVEARHRMQPMHAAANHDNADVVAALSFYGAPVDPQDEYGQTPLHMASEGHYSDTILTLLLLGADPMIRDHARQRPLDLATIGENTFARPGLSSYLLSLLSISKNAMPFPWQ